MHPRGDTLERRIARLLNPAAPNAALAINVGVQRTTIRSWLTGRRRPPVHVLRRMEDLLHSQLAMNVGLTQEHQFVIRQRENEPRRHIGATWRER